MPDHPTAERGIVNQDQRASGVLTEATRGPMFKGEGKLPADGLDLGMSQRFSESQVGIASRNSQVFLQLLLEGALMPLAKDFSIGAQFNENEIGLKGVEETHGVPKPTFVPMDAAHQGQRQGCCISERRCFPPIMPYESSSLFVLLLLAKSTGWSSRK